jgi:hypothetical protein
MGQVPVPARRLLSLGAAGLLLVSLAIAVPHGAEGKEPRRKRQRGKQRQEAAAPAAPEPREAGCGRCQGTLALLLREEGAPAPVAAFRYRLRVGEQVIEGQCPQQPGEGARCTGEGVVVGVPAGEVSLYIEAQGMRPMLQAVRQEGCCPRTEVRLALRRQ